MQIYEKIIAELTPYKNNPRNNAKAVDAVAASIKEFGFKQPVVIDRDGVIVAGHTRVLAAQKLGLKTVPCVVADDLTEEQVNAYRLADNKTNELAEWNFDLLDEELAKIGEIDMSLFGFDPAALEQGTAEEDGWSEADEEAVETRTQPGDIWQLGAHRLMCGDSTDAECLDRLMEGEKADLLFTDPPYGVDYAGKNKFLNAVAPGNRIQTDIVGDAMETAEQEKDDLWVPALKNAREHAEDTCSYYIASPQGGELMMMMMAIRDAGWQLKHTIIWNKNNHVLGRCDYNYKHEPILYGWNKQHKFYGAGQFKTSVWDIPKPQKSDLHPTMKPVALVSECLLNNTQPGDRVLDVFGGSGTTLIASEQLGRRCYMMEVTPHYCDVIIERWEKLTGEKAVLLNGGKEVEDENKGAL